MSKSQIASVSVAGRPTFAPWLIPNCKLAYL